MEKKYLIIYHKEDNDGLFSGALMKLYLVNKLNVDEDNIDLLPSTYGTLDEFKKAYSNIDDLKALYDNIIMTDISFNDWKYMKKLYDEYGSNLVWCDHHAPIIKCSIDNNFDDIPGVRDTGRSAILCVWKYLYDVFDEEYNKPKESSGIPELLRILSSWDSFTYEKNGYTLEYVHNVNVGVNATCNLDFNKVYNLIEKDTWSFIFNDNDFIDDLYKAGKTINDYQAYVMATLVRASGDNTFVLKYKNEGMQEKTVTRKCCALFLQGATNSLMFESLKKTNPDIKNGVVFKRNKNGNWVMSLYNIYTEDTFHCGDFCKKYYNGGGHVGAAGCTISEKDFLKILKNKTIGL